MHLLEGAWLAAVAVEYMNCSVRSLDSFMFWANSYGESSEKIYGLETVTHLCPDLEHVLESHTRLRQFVLQQHDDVVVMLIQQF